jgi:Ser/Thr protein kinase RdoA (MazF antagonist)
LLLDELPGEDRHGAADLDELGRMVELLVGLQRAWIGRADSLLALGLPDYRGPALTAAIADVLARTELAVDDRRLLCDFVDGLPARFAEVSACGLPDTLVHGDLHPGNFRGDAQTLALLDWGDAGVGHPLLDQSAFLDRVPAEVVGQVRAVWSAAWRRDRPGCEPERAAQLLAPVAAARQAVIYRRFLDRIEPAEQVYHREDPALWLGKTAELLRASR